MLTAATGFRDQSRSAIATISGKPSPDFDAHVAALSAEYDARLGYRFMEALRKHAQHRGVSVSGVRFNRRTDAAGRLLISVEPYVELEDLRASPKFKRSVLGELEGTAGSDGLAPWCRSSGSIWLECPP